jgi:UDP-N-acetylmuramoyl-tripeptide--D-alanyl-D-alanine ligase
MTPLWTSIDADIATSGQSTAAWQASGVSIDSRSVEAGDLFIAIAGPTFDGHQYVENAFAGGAVAALVTTKWAAGQDGCGAENPLLPVADTLEGLENLAQAARKRCTARIAAITGSAGKTGTKDMLAKALASQGRATSTRGNLNNHLGLPLSLARMPADSEFGVFELGMSHSGEIGHLANLAQPHVAVITNVEAAHLAFFESEQEIADAKAEIFQNMDATGAALLNRDNRHFQRLRDHAERNRVEQIFSFGAHVDAEFRLLDCVTTSLGSNVRASILGEIVEYNVGLPGRHLVQNSLAVIGVSYLLGADLQATASALADVQPAKGRGLHHTVTIAGGDFELIDESYNANPASMRAAIEVLAKAHPGPGGRRIAVLGDMLELGPDAPALHRSLAEDLANNDVDIVFLAGEHMAMLANAVPAQTIGTYEATSDQLIDSIKVAVSPGDVVLVKGSLGSKMTRIIDALLAIDLPLNRQHPTGSGA